MIRLAEENELLLLAADTECAVRIRSLYLIYGTNTAFLRFYTDERGGFMSIMDGNAVLYTPEEIGEEWAEFINFYGEIRSLHTHCAHAAHPALASWESVCGKVLHFTGETVKSDAEICENPYLPAVYDLLKDHFPHISTMEDWYVDYSHRVRHGFCHIATVMCQERPVSVATSVAEVEYAAILGQVATHPDHRGNGYATKCLYNLIDRMQGKHLYILPINEYAEKLYCTIGFSSCDGWVELKRK